MNISESNKQTCWDLLRTSLVGILGGVGGFAYGSQQPPEIQIQEKIITAPAVMTIESRVDDQLQVSILDQGRIVWGQDSFIEGPGEFTIPWGQIATEHDLKLMDFNYVANTKTLKFYPSNSYPARGTAYWQRRYFMTQNEAESAGFVASKLVK